MVRFSTHKNMDNLQLLHAAYKYHVFAPHFHKGHVIGVIEKGSLGFNYRGEKVVASKGQINIADPGEVHNGFPAGDGGWQYRMFYLAPGQLDRICNELCAKKKPMPFFRTGVVTDKHFAGHLLRLHKDFEDQHISTLEKESRFQALMGGFVLKHARQKQVSCKTGKEPKAVQKVKTYIWEHSDEDIRLDDLSRHAGLSRYHLLRVFSKQTGMTPHSFLSFTRASRARQMLEKKVPIADAALSSGFYDQSHLNRIFKKIYGITPGRFLNAFKGSQQGAS